MDFVVFQFIGYVLSAPPQYALPTIPAPVPFPLPFLSRELLQSKGRINFNLNYAFTPTGEDLPCNFIAHFLFFRLQFYKN